MITVSQGLRFDWDAGNSGKNKRNHDVNDWECEEAFFDPRKVILKDRFHSDKEDRFILLGKTRRKRLLFLIFTVRHEKIRVISARDVTKRKEVELYEKTA